MDERKGGGRPRRLVLNRSCMRRFWTLDLQCRYCDLRRGEKAKGFGDGLEEEVHMRCRLPRLVRTYAKHQILQSKGREKEGKEQSGR